MPEEDDNIETKTYEAIFEVVMPNEVKPRQYKIPVEASNNVEALARANYEWALRTAPSDVRIREIKPNTAKSGEKV